jgi:5,6-dimethylbenzimidazole synthase
MELQECLLKRRDTRHFLGAPVPEAVLNKAFLAAHHAPSVGLSEPWRFANIVSKNIRDALYNSFLEKKEAAEKSLEDPARKALFSSLKLEALRDAPCVVALFCEKPSEEIFTIGVQGTRDTFVWSCACAIQNFWLSLTDQGYSAGWVSIVDYALIPKLLGVPDSWEPLGLLCVGEPATDYNGQPMLEKEGWKKRTEGPIVHVV